jgi:hypothetical protein
MAADQRDRWVRWFDPSQYLPGVRGPVLFLNGSNDFAYPLDSYRRSFEMVLGEKTLSVVIGLPHGHIWNFPEVDAFVDRAMGVGGPFPRLEAKAGRRGRMEARLRDAAGPVKARLHYTTDQGAWQQRRWQSVEAVVRGRTVESDVPPERPLTAFLAIEDARGLRVSAAHGEFSGTRNTPPKR